MVKNGNTTQWGKTCPESSVIAADIASFCLCRALSQCGNLKIDTHRDNKIMQHLLEKNGFKYCGIINTDDGTERMAYQKEG